MSGSEQQEDSNTRYHPGDIEEEDGELSRLSLSSLLDTDTDAYLDEFEDVIKSPKYEHSSRGSGDDVDSGYYESFDDSGRRTQRRAKEEQSIEMMHSSTPNLAPRSKNNNNNNNNNNRGSSSGYQQSSSQKQQHEQHRQQQHPSLSPLRLGAVSLVKSSIVNLSGKTDELYCLEVTRLSQTAANSHQHIIASLGRAIGEENICSMSTGSNGTLYVNIYGLRSADDAAHCVNQYGLMRERGCAVVRAGSVPIDNPSDARQSHNSERHSSYQRHNSRQHSFSSHDGRNMRSRSRSPSRSPSPNRQSQYGRRRHSQSTSDYSRRNSSSYHSKPHLRLTNTLSVPDLTSFLESSYPRSKTECVVVVLDDASAVLDAATQQVSRLIESRVNAVLITGLDMDALTQQLLRAAHSLSIDYIVTINHNVLAMDLVWLWQRNDRFQPSSANDRYIIINRSLATTDLPTEVTSRLATRRHTAANIPVVPHQRIGSAAALSHPHLQPQPLVQHSAAHPSSAVLSSTSSQLTRPDKLMDAARAIATLRDMFPDLQHNLEPFTHRINAFTADITALAAPRVPAPHPSTSVLSSYSYSSAYMR